MEHIYFRGQFPIITNQIFTNEIYKTAEDATQACHRRSMNEQKGASFYKRAYHQITYFNKSRPA
jgi:hypothetical protein